MREEFPGADMGLRKRTKDPTAPTPFITARRGIGKSPWVFAGCEYCREGGREFHALILTNLRPERATDTPFFTINASTQCVPAYSVVSHRPFVPASLR